uniref:C-type lectin domain-containing protein n=1 Tax=Gasterosteus aculeatus aculeatus TaxID=481459 RepID=A0AAQ4QZL6_GASAC
LKVHFHYLHFVFLFAVKYYYVDTLMTWAGAQRYCREKYTDLATFESMDDVSRLPPDTKPYRWIGLSDDPKSWSSTGETSRTGYQNWAVGKPTNPLQTCAVMLADGRWNEYSSTKSFVLIQLSKSWSAARDYCREHYTDLAKIENDEEKNEVNSANPSHGIVWIGLYRVSWTWSDKSQSSFRVWASGEPNSGKMIEICAMWSWKRKFGVLCSNCCPRNPTLGERLNKRWCVYKG